MKITLRGAKTGQQITIKAKNYAPDTELRNLAACLGALWDEDVDILGEYRTGDRIAKNPSHTKVGDTLAEMQY